MKLDEDEQTTLKDQSKSRLGTWAFILSVMPFLMFCILIVVYLMMLGAASLDTTSGDLAGFLNQTAGIISYLVLCPAILGTIAPLAGIILGVLGLVRKEPRKGYAITGIVLGILTAPVMCGITILITQISRA